MKTTIGMSMPSHSVTVFIAHDKLCWRLLSMGSKLSQSDTELKCHIITRCSMPMSCVRIWKAQLLRKENISLKHGLYLLGIPLSDSQALLSECHKDNSLMSQYNEYLFVCCVVRFIVNGTRVNIHNDVHRDIVTSPMITISPSLVLESYPSRRLHRGAFMKTSCIQSMLWLFLPWVAAPFSITTWSSGFINLPLHVLWRLSMTRCSLLLHNSLLCN